MEITIILLLTASLGPNLGAALRCHSGGELPVRPTACEFRHTHCATLPTEEDKLIYGCATPSYELLDWCMKTKRCKYCTEDLCNRPDYGNDVRKQLGGGGVEGGLNVNVEIGGNISGTLGGQGGGEKFDPSTCYFGGTFPNTQLQCNEDRHCLKIEDSGKTAKVCGTLTIDEDVLEGDGHLTGPNGQVIYYCNTDLCNGNVVTGGRNSRFIICLVFFTTFTWPRIIPC